MFLAQSLSLGAPEWESQVALGTQAPPCAAHHLGALLLLHEPEEGAGEPGGPRLPHPKPLPSPTWIAIGGTQSRDLPQLPGLGGWRAQAGVLGAEK